MIVGTIVLSAYHESAQIDIVYFHQLEHYYSSRATISIIKPLFLAQNIYISNANGGCVASSRLDLVAINIHSERERERESAMDSLSSQMSGATNEERMAFVFMFRKCI